MYKILIRVILETLANKTLLTALASMATAQILKVAYYRITEKKFNIIHFFEAGGMPSSHSALTCSLTMMVGLTQGFNSILLAAVAIIAAIVMYDAIKVRAEEVGHTLVEVSIGGVIGIVISLISYVLFF